MGHDQPDEKPLLQRPMTEVEIDDFDDQYFERAHTWLLTLGCSFERVKDRPGVYHLTLPPGTIEQVLSGQSTLWTHVTELLLPDGTLIRKYLVQPLAPGPAVTKIRLPRAILMGSEEESDRQILATPRSTMPAWLTIRQAAGLLETKARTLSNYVQHGRLGEEHRDGLLLVSRNSLAAFAPRVPGRPRFMVPPWRQASELNSQWVTLIMVRQRPEQEEHLACLLKAMREQQMHCVPGTTARAIVCNQGDPDELLLVLTWRTSAMPSREEREARLAALRTSLAEVLNWETSVVKEGISLLHA